MPTLRSRADREYQRLGGPGRPCAYFVEWFRAKHQRLGGGSGPSLRLEPGQATELEQQAREQLGQRGPAGFAFRPTPRAAETNPRNPLHLDSIEGRTADNGSLKAGETV